MENKKRVSVFDSILGGIETVCNKLPSPFTMFAYLFVILAVISTACGLLGVSVVNPASGEVVVAQSFFSQAGLKWILTSLVTNFTGYASLGLVLTMTFGINMCEQVGLVSSVLRKSTSNVNRDIVPYVIALIGTCGNLASDTCTVLVPPLAAMAFLGVGRNPIAGMICGWIAANAGFTANLMIAGTDALVAGITNTAIKGFLGEATTFQVDSACNWYFMVASTFLVTMIIGWCTNHILEPRLGDYHGEAVLEKEELTALQNKALKRTGIVVLIYAVVIAAGVIGGPLANPETGGVVGSLFLSGLIPIILVMFVLAAITYGITMGEIKGEKDVSRMAAKAMGSMSTFIAFCFMAGQFTALFNWTKLGTIMAVAGANFLSAIGLTDFPMFVAIIILVMIINIFVGSSSAKWTILAPVFVPMLMLMGYHPAWIQLLYRIGDSPTNALTPLSAYLYMCLDIIVAKYDKNMKLGTFIANCLPTVMILQVLWIAFTMIWFAIGLPLGPGAGFFLPEGLL